MDANSAYQFYSIIFRTYCMQQPKEIEVTSSPQPRNRVLGVIVLTDNRQDSPADKPLLSDFRSSAFRETQVDPLQFCRGGWIDPAQSELIERLSQRVTALERRLQELSRLDKQGSGAGRGECQELKKKHRRKFKDLIRDHQCPICQKIYGSETSLKYHLKLKHAKHDENHSQSN